MKVKQLPDLSALLDIFSRYTNLAQILAVGTLAMGASIGISSAPAYAVSLNNSNVTFGSSIPTFFADVNPGSDDTISVTFATPTDVGSANGLLDGASFFPAAGMYALAPVPTATFDYVSGDNSRFAYSLRDNLTFSFAKDLDVTVVAGTIFKGERNGGSATFSTIDAGMSFFKTRNDLIQTQLLALSFGFNDIDSRGNGIYGLTASTVEPVTASVPEPLTIVGTILGGAAAVRIKRKLTDAAKE